MKFLVLSGLLFAAVLASKDLSCTCLCCAAGDTLGCSESGTGTQVGSILVATCTNCTQDLCASAYPSSCFGLGIGVSSIDCSFPLINPYAILGAAAGATVGFALILFGLIFIYRHHKGRPVFQVETVGTTEIQSWQTEDTGRCASTSVGRAVVATLLMLKSEFFLVLFAMALAQWQAIKDAYFSFSEAESLASVVEVILIIFLVIFVVETAAAVAALMLEFCPAGGARCGTHSLVWTVMIVLEVPSFILGGVFLAGFIFFEILATSFVPSVLILLVFAAVFCSCCVGATVCCCRIPKNRGTGYAVVAIHEGN